MKMNIQINGQSFNFAEATSIPHGDVMIVVKGRCADDHLRKVAFIALHQLLEEKLVSIKNKILQITHLMQAPVLKKRGANGRYIS
jgi:hypothetical protein